MHPHTAHATAFTHAAVSGGRTCASLHDICVRGTHDTRRTTSASADIDGIQLKTGAQLAPAADVQQQRRITRRRCDAPQGLIDVRNPHQGRSRHANRHTKTETPDASWHEPQIGIYFLFFVPQPGILVARRPHRSVCASIAEAPSQPEPPSARRFPRGRAKHPSTHASSADAPPLPDHRPARLHPRRRTCANRPMHARVADRPGPVDPSHCCRCSSHRSRHSPTTATRTEHRLAAPARAIRPAPGSGRTDAASPNSTTSAKPDDEADDAS
jgi:hypothetical protein